MTEPTKYFKNCNLIVEVAAVGFALATLFISSMGRRHNGATFSTRQHGWR